MAASTIHSLAEALLTELQRACETLVLAESCTGGLAAATLVGVPGASQMLAGSLVVYQEASKTAWLGVPRDMLSQHTAVSRPVAEAMVAGTLGRTPHATIAGAITGHLDSAAGNDRGGTLFVAVGRRDEAVTVREVHLAEQPTDRRERQSSAAWHLLAAVHAHLEAAA